jgi:hypothetical protein
MTRMTDQALQPKNFRKMFREIMAIRTSQMMTSRSLICLLENQNGGKLQKCILCYYKNEPLVVNFIFAKFHC